MRRRQNNPILVGEAGVGKTAVAEGFAHKIVEGTSRRRCKASACSSSTSASAGRRLMKGEFEERLKQVIEEVQASSQPTILFIDEVHRLIGAGGAAGTGDAANCSSPPSPAALLRTVAATTWAEYKKHIEKDPALTRRFQTVQVDEPDEERAIKMMRKVAGDLREAPPGPDPRRGDRVGGQTRAPLHPRPPAARQGRQPARHRLRPRRHRPARRPAEVDDCRKRIEALEHEIEILRARRTRAGTTRPARRPAIKAAIEERETSANSRRVEEGKGTRRQDPRPARASSAAGRRPRAETVAGWTAAEQASDAATKRRRPGEPGASRGRASTDDALADEERDRPSCARSSTNCTPSSSQGRDPLILPSATQRGRRGRRRLDRHPGRQDGQERDPDRPQLADTLAERVIGQDHGLAAIAKRIQTSRAGLDNPGKPIGVFMLAGPSGVGKTETALALAEALYGGEQNVVTINMSEFQEAHTVSTLKGAPPGYVGYGEGGILTEAVRRKPYSVVLLDEVEKAHSDVHEIFFQVFDKGVMEDGEGRRSTSRTRSSCSPPTSART
jgi:type VI secretion system protein VasG